MKEWYDNLTVGQLKLLYFVSFLLIFFYGIGLIPLTVLIFYALGDWSLTIGGDPLGYNFLFLYKELQIQKAPKMGVLSIVLIRVIVIKDHKSCDKRFWRS